MSSGCVSLGLTFGMLIQQRVLFQYVTWYKAFLKISIESITIFGGDIGASM